ncbi:unnamed protein product, partial [marine sediment metagenome]
EIDITSKAIKKFGIDNIAFTIHSHFELMDKGERSFTNHFSLDDLIQSITFGDIPGLLYREYERELKEGKVKEYETYYLKVAPNLPKDRMSLINEYGLIFKEIDKENDKFKKRWGADKDSFYFMNLSNEDYTKHDKERDSIIDKYVSKVEEFEKKYGFQTKKISRNIYNPKKKEDFIEAKPLNLVLEEIADFYEATMDMILIEDGLTAGSTGAQVSGAKRTKVGQSLGLQSFQVEGPETIT